MFLVVVSSFAHLITTRGINGSGEPQLSGCVSVVSPAAAPQTVSAVDVEVAGDQETMRHPDRVLVSYLTDYLVMILCSKYELKQVKTSRCALLMVQCAFGNLACVAMQVKY